MLVKDEKDFLFIILKDYNKFLSSKDIKNFKDYSGNKLEICDACNPCELYKITMLISMLLNIFHSPR